MELFLTLKLYVSKTELFKMELFRHLNCVLMLNWIVWNWTVLTFNLTVLIQNWIIWNRTVYMFENGFGINNL